MLFRSENALVIANTLFQQHKRRHYTWTSPDGQHRNQIDYVLCSQRLEYFLLVGKNHWRRDRLPIPVFLGFPGGSAGKESTCNAGDPGLGRSAGEGIVYPLQYSWAFLVAQLVKNTPAMQETPVRFLGQEDLLEKRWATHSNILGLSWWLRW